MTETEFLLAMEDVDRKLQNDDVPIPGRAFETFFRLAPDYDKPILGYGVDPSQFPDFVGPNLFKRICDWYQERYGDRVCFPAYISRVPVLLRKQVYLIRIPIGYGRPEVKILPLVEGLTQHMIDSLDDREVEAVVRSFKDGFALIYEIDDMRFHLDPKDPSAVSPGAIRLLGQAIEDRDTAVSCLDNRFDTNGSCFHAQQHAEKTMKGFLLARNLFTEDDLRKRPFGHNIENVFKECLKVSSAFLDLTNDIGLLKLIPMDIRYTSLQVGLETAVETFWASLWVGGLAACQISGSERRYRNPRWIK